ncbi:hypothetical protein [Aquabacterium sp.]|uniref:hypothetical protein n=1 Tax=Aquabacterium sp. TaxID=1872578 RepID=UPI003D6D7859
MMFKHQPRRLGVFALLVALMAWCTLFAPAAQAQGSAEGRPFRDSLGLVVKFSQGQPMSQLPLLGELGLRWVRDTVMWADMEPKAGQYSELPAAFKQRLAYYREHKISVVFMLAYANGKAYPATKDDPLAPINPEAFGRYAVHMAKVLKQSGVNFVLEVWNEPHNFVIAKMVGGQWNGKPPSPWVKHYVKMVTEVVEQVKAVDPSVKIIDCEDVWVAHYWFMEAGLPKALDGFGIHPYSGHNAVGPEVSAAYEKTDWALPFQLVDRDRSFNSAVRRLRDQGLKKMGKRPEIWITEWGWSVGEKTPDGPVTEDMLAAFLPRSFISSVAAGVEVLCWFSAQDTVDGPMGLVTNDGRKRPAFGAYKTMVAELGDLSFGQQLGGLGRPTQGVQAYLFKGAGVRKVVLWSSDNKARTFKVKGAWSIKKAVNLQGAEIDIDDPKAKSVTVGPEPIYLTLDGNDTPKWSDDLVQ